MVNTWYKFSAGQQYLNLHTKPNKVLSLQLYVYSFLESLSVKHNISGR